MVVDNHPSTHPPLPPTTEDERLSWLRLLRSRRVGPATFYRMLGEHGSATAALEALPGIARDAGIDRYAPCPLSLAEQELARGRAMGARLVARGEAGYPLALEDLADAPPLLWLRGRFDLAATPGVAVVGARQASSLGMRMARALAGDLGQAGQIVISGLARGIDTMAHEAALATGTVAVFPGGLDQVYPQENAALAARIAEEGLCLSEQPPGLVPQQRHFPQRNRLVSGLARALVVVEAATKSGTLNTARHALDQGREVLAVPGHPFEARASGCNALLRDGAGLVRHARDVLEVLGIDPATAQARLQLAEPPAAPSSGHGAPGEMAASRDTADRRTLRQATGERMRPDAATPLDQGTGKMPAPEPHALDHGARAETPAGRRVSDPAPTRPLREVARLHRMILDRLAPGPVEEEALLATLNAPARRVAPVLTDLELEGRIRRHPGGLIARGEKDGT